MPITIMLFLLFLFGIPLALFFIGLAVGLIVDNPYNPLDRYADAAMKLGGAWFLVGVAVLVIMMMIAPAMV